MLNDAVGFEKIFQSVGKMKVTMFSMMAGSITNIILDPLLIFGIGPFPRMEIKGAAIASVLAEASSILFFLIYIRGYLMRSLCFIRQRPLDAVQEECFLLDMMSIQINLELLEQVCRHLECNGSGFCTAHPLFHLCLIKCCDQPSHVFAQALPGLFLMFPDLSVQVYRDLRTQIFCVCHICVLLSS